MSLSLRFAAGSHDGMIREHNEDSGYAGPRLLAVADGMGGQAAGEVASSEVISTFVQLDEDVPGSDILTSLGNAVQRANDQLRLMVEEDQQLEGMGTTLTALLWTGQRLGLVHVGDSRAYLLRDGRLEQITQDHTWVQRLVDEGRITEEEATTHPQRSLLMRALGSGDHVEPDLSIREVRAGDRYLLCSDGLSGVVSHQTLEETLGSYQGPHETVQELIQLALRGGGPDNITCLVADVLDVDSDSRAEQLNDTPVIVGAVAENQPQLGNDAQTPAARAAELGRQVPPQQQAGGATPPEGTFGPPGSGSGPSPAPPPPVGSFGAYTNEDFTKPQQRAKWGKRSLIIALALVVVGAALYGGYRWTQSQYYVGAKDDDHVALYQGINQELAGISLSQVHEDHREIELKYLPMVQRDKVEETIAAGSLEEAEDKVRSLATQARVCKIVAEQEQDQPPADGNKDGKDQKDGGKGDQSSDAGRSGGAGAGDRAQTESDKDGRDKNQRDDKSSSSPTPGPQLSEEERELAKTCTAP
ncbi:Stp1/IreP family PP2C-type Ser/Thr phosphatase [Streptomyces oceani]